MALVNCSECNQKISDQAVNCPKCGAPVDLDKIKENKKLTQNGCFIFLGIIAFIWIVVSISNNSDTNSDNETYPEPEPLTIISTADSLKFKKELDSINKYKELEESAFKKTKAGKIQTKHPEWSKEDCELIAKNKIWIGMHYDMLLYMRGKPNTINTSNYGSGNEYQCCWDDYDISCFYMKEDNIITSYN